MLPQGNKNEEVSEDLLARYRDAVSYIEAFSNSSIGSASISKDQNVFIQRTSYLLGLVGNPERSFEYVHVTGTAGKGSVSTLIHSMLVLDGRKAGLFTSPYATTAIEEIQVADRYISPGDFIDIVEYLKPFIARLKDESRWGAPTAFEIFFVIALLYFKRENCQWAVIEVGVGGRYDPTNVIPAPRAAVITNIDYDHTDILGPRLSDIAFDKAGIIKKGGLFFTAEKKSAIRAIFERACNDVGAVYSFVPVLKTTSETNLSLAKAVAKAVGLSPSSIAACNENVSLPCRFEVMSHSPLIILDGAHDRIKIRSTVSRLKNLSFSKLHLILGVSGIKPDTKPIFPGIVPLADSLTITSLVGSRRRLAYPDAVLALAQEFTKPGIDVASIVDAHEAMKAVLKKASPGDCVLVTGSFFLAGELRKEWFTEKEVLERRRSFK